MAFNDKTRSLDKNETSLIYPMRRLHITTKLFKIYQTDYIKLSITLKRNCNIKDFIAVRNLLLQLRKFLKPKINKIQIEYFVIPAGTFLINIGGLLRQ